MDPAALRAHFPVLERLHYLNAGTDGPIPREAVAASAAEIERQAAEGRWGAHWERTAELRVRQRAAYAGLLGADPAEVALTTSASEGLARVIGGLALGPGDEILHAHDEHPGLLGPLARARALRGVTLRAAPLSGLADAVGPATRLIACSHVAWTTGELAPSLRDAGVPVVLDGAQGLGAIAVDVRALGCAAYAAAGQKWLCGPDGTGVLWLDPQFARRVAVPGPVYGNLADPAAGLDAVPWPDARAHDAPALSAEASAFALAALDLLGGFGWDRVLERGPRLAAALAEMLAAAGHTVAPRGDSTLVSWRSDDPAGDVERLAAAGIVVRGLPGLPLVRASVGAWNDDSDLDALVAAL